MNKQIPSLAAFVIVLLAGAVFLVIFLKSYNSYEEVAVPVMQKTEKSAECKPRAFSGETTIKAWPTDEQEDTLQIAKDDVSKLPLEKDKIKLVDASSSVEKKIRNSSENKPAELTITGFMSLCDGTTLASLNYKDGIFRPYLKK